MKIKKVSVLLLVVSLVVLSGCTKKQEGVNETKQEQKQEQTNGESFSGSLKQLLGMGKKVVCSFEYKDPEGKSLTSGTVYIDGVRNRSEIKIKAEGDEGNEELNMNVISISDGKTGYMWNDGQKTGTKFDIAEMEKTGEEAREQNQNQQDIQKNFEEKYDYKCKDWRVDESKFNVPTDVEFVDMMEQVKQMKEGLADVCNQLPEPQKSQCLESMKE